MAIKKAYCFDFDETLVKTEARILVYRNGAFYKSLTSKEFNFFKPGPHDTFNFADFKNPDMILNAKKYKMWPVIKNISNSIKTGKSDSTIFILTARAPVVKSTIYELLKQHGIEIELEHVITIGDDAGKIDISKEKQIVLRELATKYNPIMFFDDDPKNIALAAGIKGIRTRLVESQVKIKKEYERAIDMTPKIVKFVKEDMGGVSAPMSTPANTPGMGSAVPPSKGGIGSGDRWDNKVASKRKKKKKLEEDNVNPYDKLGMAMAKKVGAATPFKKKKSKGNQNAMKQQKFEHQIITLDDFVKQINENK
jgi:FMN phosphatase YigB (HAD superfamily)